jgi:hypothetical protein
MLFRVVSLVLCVVAEGAAGGVGRVVSDGCLPRSVWVGGLVLSGARVSSSPLLVSRSLC